LAHKVESKEVIDLQQKRSAPSLTQMEVKTAIQLFPPSAWLRLHKVARTFCRHTSMEADDLMQEAFRRALDGSRQCPRHVDVLRFVAGAMRSIASDWRKARMRRPHVSHFAATGALQEVIVRVRDVCPDPHELLASEQEAACMRKAILEVFADDPVALKMLEGIMEGLEGEELRSFTQLDETEFASKRRLVRRRIDKAFPKEFKQ
jgi:DNA-directed RNA polymerase specialized sigma24 family protein